MAHPSDQLRDPEIVAALADLVANPGLGRPGWRSPAGSVQLLHDGGDPLEPVRFVEFRDDYCPSMVEGEGWVLALNPWWPHVLHVRRAPDVDHAFPLRTLGLDGVEG